MVGWIPEHALAGGRCPPVTSDFYAGLNGDVGYLGCNRSVTHRTLRVLQPWVTLPFSGGIGWSARLAGRSPCVVRIGHA